MSRITVRPGTPGEADRILAIEDGCYRIVKRHGRWWIISPTGLARPTSSWRTATSLVPW